MKQRWLLMGLFPLLIVNTAWGNPAEKPAVMTLEQAVPYALKNNPGINAERQKLGIGKGQKAQADMLVQYNPKFSGIYFNRNTQANKRYDDFQFSLSQQLEVAGQPGLRRDAAKLNLKKIEWDIKNAERLLKAKVKQAFYAFLIIKERVQLVQQVVNFKREMLAISEKRHEVGDISRLQVDLNQVGLMRAQKEQLEIKREYNRHLFQFKQIINWDLGKKLGIEGKITTALLKPDKDNILRFALEKRPDLLAAKHNLEQADKQAQLAYSKRIPNITVSANYQRDEGSDLVGAGITIPIPVFNRNQGDILKTRARQDVLEYQLANLRTEAGKEISTATENFELAVAEVKIFKQEILPRLDKTLERIREAFRFGQIDQLTVTVSQNEFIQTRFSYLDALGEYYQTLVELEKATNSNLNDLNLTN